MVQIIEEAPSFSSDLGGILGQSLGAFGKSFMDTRQKTKKDEQLRQLIGEDISGLPPDLQEIMLKYKLEGQNKQSEIARKLQSEQSEVQKKMQQDEAVINDLEERFGLKKGNLKAYIGKPELAMKVAKPEGTSQESKKELLNTAQKSFNGMAELLKKRNLGLGSGIRATVFGGETAKDIGEFQSLSGGLEAILVDMVSRGTLSESRFNYITKYLLPNSEDRDKTIEGKLKGLSEILGLDASSLNLSEKAKETKDEKGRPPLSSFKR